ncbi:MAG TPA: DUF86 domain-containing protein [Tepidisphaeraceae bacterium]|jgi:uncharacterized protein with HEPN domain
MPLNTRDAASLRDILDAAEIIAGYVAGRDWEQYQRDQMLRDAVERRVEIIGEAARRLSPEFRATTPQVPWRQVMATRNILAHDYDEVEDTIIWRIATFYVPELAGSIRPLLTPPPPDPEPEE